MNKHSKMRPCFLYIVSFLCLKAFEHNLNSSIRDTTERTPALDMRLGLLNSKFLFSLHFHEEHTLKSLISLYNKVITATNVRMGLFVISKCYSISSENVSSVTTTYYHSARKLYLKRSTPKPKGALFCFTDVWLQKFPIAHVLANHKKTWKAVVD